MSDDRSFSQRVRYSIDNFLARGSSALFLSLTLFFIAGLVVISGLRLVLNLFDPDLDRDVAQHVWTVFLELTDPGNMNQDIMTPPIFKLAAVVAGFTGVVLFSSLIAFLTTGLSDAISHLRKGHSRVLESDHTLILGWGPRVVEILSELVVANESKKDAVVVILSTEDKEAMDEHLRTQFTDRRTTRVVTRHGSPSSLRGLDHVSTKQARSAIVLALCSASDSEEEKLASDARVMQTVLALTTYVGESSSIGVVAEIFDTRNRSVVEDISPEHVVVVDAEEMLAKIMVQTSRTSGLSVVYSELLSFNGCEMYFYEADWKSRTFGETQFYFKDGVPIGVRRKGSGKVWIRPPADTRLEEGDQLLLVAEDDSALGLESAPVAKPAKRALPGSRAMRRKERMLIIGWSQKAPTVISQYAEYVLAGSTVDILIAEPSEELALKVKALDDRTSGLSVSIVEKHPLDQRELESVAPFDYDTVLVLGHVTSDHIDPERVDAQSIVVLLHLRKLARRLRERGSEIRTKVITEVLVSSNQELVSRAGVDDFIISNKMVSMIFAQLSEEPKMKVVYDNLFQEDGSEIYVKSANLYFDKLPATCQFADLMALCQQRQGEVCIGYKLKAFETNRDKNYGVFLVPEKHTKVTLGPDDALVVVAEDDL